MFVPVQGEFTSSSNYAFVSGDYRETVSGNDTVYTYPVVFESGEPGSLATKTAITGTAKNNVHEYQNSGSYVNFDNPSDTNTVNNRLVTHVGSNSITTVDATTGDGERSYATSGSTVWDVQDVNNIFDSSIQLNDKVALVLKDGKVKTAFIYDHVDGDLATAADMDFTGNIGVALTQDADGNYVAYGVNAGDTLTRPVALNNDDQTVTVKAKILANATDDGALGAAVASTNGFKVDKDTDFDAGHNVATIYTADGTEAGTTIQVTVTVAEAGYATRTLTYNVILWNGVETLGDPTVTVKSPVVNGATLGCRCAAEHHCGRDRCTRRCGCDHHCHRQQAVHRCAAQCHQRRDREVHRSCRS